MMDDVILVLRTPSGVSGDMLVAGLAGLSDLDADGFALSLSRLGLPELADAARIVPRNLDGIAGIGLELDLPPSHAHRHLPDILAIIAKSAMSGPAKDMAAKAFGLLAEAEAAVHGARPDDVHFHEVGALDSLLDVCLACELFAQLAPKRFVCSPLPICDGTVRCEHGLLSTPAPAVMHLLCDVPVYGIQSVGETVTPTAAALLKAMGATFGPWPPLVLGRHVRTFGGRVLPGIPNGAVFALGRHWELPASDNAEESAAYAPAHSHAGDAVCDH